MLSIARMRVPLSVMPLVESWHELAVMERLSPGCHAVPALLTVAVSEPPPEHCWVLVTEAAARAKGD